MNLVRKAIRDLCEEVQEWMAEEPDPREDDPNASLSHRERVLMRAGFIEGEIDAALRRAEKLTPTSPGAAEPIGYIEPMKDCETWAYVHKHRHSDAEVPVYLNAPSPSRGAAEYLDEKCPCGWGCSKHGGSGPFGAYQFGNRYDGVLRGDTAREAREALARSLGWTPSAATGEKESNWRLTPRQQGAMLHLLARVASWTNARWDQHLREDVGDPDANAIVAWAILHLGATAGAHENIRITELVREGLKGQPAATGEKVSELVASKCDDERRALLDLADAQKRIERLDRECQERAVQHGKDVARIKELEAECVHRGASTSVAVREHNRAIEAIHAALNEAKAPGLGGAAKRIADLAEANKKRVEELEREKDTALSTARTAEAERDSATARAEKAESAAAEHLHLFRTLCREIEPLAAMVKHNDTAMSHLANVLREWREDKERIATVDEIIAVTDARVEQAEMALTSAQSELAERKETIERMLAAAHGSHDFGGGHTGNEYKAFQHGISTVCNVLEDVARGERNMQIGVLVGIGRHARSTVSPSTPSAPPAEPATCDTCTQTGCIDVNPDDKRPCPSQHSQAYHPLHPRKRDG